MDAEFIVHSIPGSPFGRAVMATLEEKQARWRIAPLPPGTLKQQPHLSRHPFGRVPVLEHGDLMLYETQAILRYLDRLLPEPPLTPATARGAARMDQVMAVNDWYLFQNCGNIIGFQRVVGPALLGLTPNDAIVVEAMPRAHTVFAELSRLLAGSTWFSGADVSLADLLVAPQVEFFSRTPEWSALTAERANLVAWLERAEARPSLQATTWDRVAALAQAA